MKKFLCAFLLFLFFFIGVKPVFASCDLIITSDNKTNQYCVDKTADTTKITVKGNNATMGNAVAKYYFNGSWVYEGSVNVRSGSFSFDYPTSKLVKGDNYVKIDNTSTLIPGELCQARFIVYDKCTAETNSNTGKTLTSNGASSCPNHPNDSSYVYTAIGCIPTQPAQFASTILTYALSLGGGIAFLLMSYAAFELITSNGNPEHLTRGKDRLISALAGLLFIMFSVFILKLVGVDILKIPGFN